MPRAKPPDQTIAQRAVFADRLRRARQAAGFESGRAAARSFAEATGLSAMNYRQYESGKATPGFFHLIQMVEVLGLDPRILIPELLNRRYRRTPPPPKPGAERAADPTAATEP